MEHVFSDTMSLVAKIPQEPSVRYRGLVRDRHVPTQHGLSIIDINNDDCVDTCIRIAQRYPERRIGLLNMASEMSPGGGVARGAIAQEEDVCRRTTLYPTLTQQRYPLAHDELLYTPNVKIVKGADYKRLSSFVQIAGVVSAAAIRRPTLNRFGKMNHMDVELVKNKVRMVLETFEYHHMDHIVLGAWGCGAFRNPPNQIAAIFKETLQDFYFGHVTFAIMTPWAHDLPNIRAFVDVFAFTSDQVKDCVNAIQSVLNPLAIAR